MRDYSKMEGKKNPNYKTGLRVSGVSSSIYHSWQNMKQRCLNPKHHKYARYGGRGIKVCDEWLDISGFYSWAVNNGWKEGLSIDRVDNDGNYCPENCRWISVSENSKNKSTTKISDVEAEKIRKEYKKGIDMLLAEKYNCSVSTIRKIIHFKTHF